MMFKKALTKSGRRILRAIKRISSTRLAKKLQEQQEQQQQQQIYQQQQQQQQQEKQQWSLQQRLYELDSYSGVSCSLPSLDAKSVDTFVTYVQPDGLYQSEECYVPHCCCCSCNENEENQRNENLENEMMR